MTNACENKMNIIRTSLLFLVTLTVTSCGGGGGGDSSSTSDSTSQTTTTTTTSDTNTSQPESFTPDPKKLEEAAGESSELYVEEDFDFNTHKTLTLDIQAYNSDGEPLANTLMFLSSIPIEMTEKESELIAEKSLIGVYKTNENGAYYGQVEVSVNVHNTLIQLNTLGIENEVILAITEDNLLQHQF